MSKRILWKNAFQSITDSLGRFISIFLLMAVSAFTFIGLKMAGPDMRFTATNFYRQQQLADLTVTSNYGLDRADQKIILHTPGLKKADFGYFQDSTVNHSRTAIRVFSKTDGISKYQLVKGHLPTNNRQIAVSSLLANRYHIGQTITLNQHSSLKNTHFKVVGYVRSSEYIDRNDFGHTNISTGQLNGYALVNKAAFASPQWMIARLTFKKTAHLNPYSTAYQNYVDQRQRHLQAQLNHQRADKVQRLQQALQAQMMNQQVSSAQTAKSQSLQSAALPTSADKITYTVNDRSQNPGYEIYHSNVQRIDILANIFPVFMFFVAALVCLTTMTRFVEEERTNIGTLKSLGYSNLDVCQKFIVYGLTSSLLGVLFGAIFGYLFLPKMIFTAYGANSTLTGFTPLFNWVWLIVAAVVAVACTTLSALWTLSVDLKESPARLLLPKAPKSGSRILLERVKPLWNRLSFKHKITARNLFRYKPRMLMTIIGVAGCTGLLVMGFGISDSLKGISQQQYGNIIRYDLVIQQKDPLAAAQSARLKHLLTSDHVQRHTSIYWGQLHRKLGEDHAQQNINLIVPRDSHSFNDYLHLQNRSTKRPIKLTNNGVVISEKLAKLTDSKVGSRIRLQDSNGQWRSFKVAGITEMYMGHFLIMNQHEYRHYFKRPFTSNAQLVTLKHHQDLQSFSASAMASGAVLGINQNVNNQRTIENTMDSMNKVMVILIGLATLLAIVVIYNLTTINVLERMRELSTIKVLGFFDGEVTMYIYRETIILSLLGIILGYFIGAWLHHFIITTLPPTNAMFDPNLYLSNFLLSAFIPAAITLLLALLVYRRIKHVDMLEALQSVD
ncbi:ABC transporter permease [Limosilactobacillus secaliphilus]|uniref:ABC transporter permease n=1 Tax=Limosilactobacillus secaliphilus TaxID=396268 RepID=A0A0R2I889_9LACO|nr:FtsX-like permease family protein [Limosilactobacillus secaliphilus]KRN58556.1 ABC transporter permease [Limosilactobacillus secaliphilus]